MVGSNPALESRSGCGCVQVLAAHQLAMAAKTGRDAKLQVAFEKFVSMKSSRRPCLARAFPGAMVFAMHWP